MPSCEPISLERHRLLAFEPEVHRRILASALFKVAEHRFDRFVSACSRSRRRDRDSSCRAGSRAVCWSSPGVKRGVGSDRAPARSTASSRLLLRDAIPSAISSDRGLAAQFLEERGGALADAVQRPRRDSAARARCAIARRAPGGSPGGSTHTAYEMNLMPFVSSNYEPRGSVRGCPR